MGGDFDNSDRFVVQERLGVGAMGVVYKAHDRDRDAPVALKLLRQVDANAIYRFKQEFRALADVTHPNLVTLHELVSIGDEWFFTMELVDGVDFLAYVAGTDARAAGSPKSNGETIDTIAMPVRGASSDPQPDSETIKPQSARALSPHQLARLRRGLTQLAEGVVAIHDAGRLHRDLKPSNVLVTGADRVVILDFGVTTELRRRDTTLDDRRLVGTPAYMAPEQGGGKRVSEATDWYAVGVMLYEALTGVRPFSGSTRFVLASKQSSDPRTPDDLVPATPRDLSELCMALLSRDPKLRPTGAEVLAHLGVGEDSASPASIAARVADVRGRLVGRTAQLLMLREAFDAVRRREQRTVLVHGTSGVGKSALIATFLADVERTGGAVVLTGRCYERESVRYKALDSLIDALSRYLVNIERGDAWQLMPRDVWALARLFPVLRRVEAVLGASAESLVGLDAVELRRRAFNALRELLTRLAARGPVVIHIDDVQWGDADSATLLEHVLRRPDAPPVLFVASYRREDAETSEFLSGMSPALKHAVVLSVDPLSPEEANELALSLLQDDSPLARSLSKKVAHESGGNPFFVLELCRHLRRSEESGETVSLGVEPTLDEMLGRRFEELPAGARRLLDIVSVAAGPVPQSVAIAAAGLPGDEQAAVTALRNGNLVRTRGVHTTDAIECFHDRIRENVARRLSEEQRREIHASLGRAFDAEGKADPETLWLHFEGAGDRERASHYIVQAAELAEQALAFERAAALYRRALSIRSYAGAEAARLRGRLGDALANAARRAEAAEVFEEGARTADDALALELRRKAAESYLLSGHLDEGVRALQQVLDVVGLPMPRTPRRAVVSFLARRAWIRLRGLSFKARPIDEVPVLTQRRIEACWSAAIGFALCDHMRGAAFQSRHLLTSLRSGEPHHIARALALEAGYMSTRGKRGKTRASKIADEAERLAADIGESELSGWAAGARGLIAYQMGEWRRTRDQCRASRALLMGRTQRGAPWEVTTVLLYELWSLYYLGELAELAKRVPRLLRQAYDRDDLITASCLAGGLTNTAWLVADDVAGARRIVKDLSARWMRQDFHLQHYWQWMASSHFDLYAGDGEAAWRRTEEAWEPMSRSYILRITVIGFSALHVRGRCALAAAVAGHGDREAMIRAAERDAARMARYRFNGTSELAALQRAGALALRGNRDEAAAVLAGVETGFEAAEMPFHATAARRRRGELVGGNEGDDLIADADEWYRGQLVANPARLTAMVAPGFD